MKKIISISFIIIQFVLHLFIIWPGHSYYAETHLAYLAIILCFAFSLLNIRKDRVLLLLGGLFFTVLADTCLVPKFNGFYEQGIGITFFSITQLLYATYLFVNLNKKYRLPHIIVRVTIVAMLLTVTPIILQEKTDYVSMITMFYLANFICNIVFAFINIKKNILLPIGLCLFLLCDITTGLIGADGVYFSVPTNSIIYKIFFTDFNLTWFFYLPSQVLIALSTTDFNK